LSTQRAIVRRRDVESGGDGQTRPRTRAPSTGGWDAILPTVVIATVIARHHEDARGRVDRTSSSSSPFLVAVDV
jgi:hypothetical protein